MHTGLKAQNVNAKQKMLKQHSMVQVVTSGETHTSTKISLKDKHTLTLQQKMLKAA